MHVRGNPLVVEHAIPLTSFAFFSFFPMILPVTGHLSVASPLVAMLRQHNVAKATPPRRRRLTRKCIVHLRLAVNSQIPEWKTKAWHSYISVAIFDDAVQAGP